jgi:hypothetical protein
MSSLSNGPPRDLPLVKEGKKNMFLGARSFEFVNLTYEKTSKVKVWVVERL